MISLRKTCLAVASAFALSMTFSAGPAAAQMHDQASVDAQSKAHNDYWCNPVTNITPRNIVRSSNGAPVLQKSSYPCPVAEAAPTPAPTPAAPQTYTVYFDFDRSFIRQDARPVLQQALQAAETEDKTFALTGHTD